MFEWTNWWGTLAGLAIVVVALVLLSVALWVINVTVGRHSPWLREVIAGLRFHALLLVLIVGCWIAAGATAPAEYSWWPALSRAFFIASVIAGAIFLGGFASFGFARLLGRFPDTQQSVPEIRRMRTQLKLIRRLVNVLIGVIAVGVVLFSFPEVRAVGTSVLASAGIQSHVAGLAAHSTLGNLVAGIQLVYSDAIRVGDVVVVEDEWGTIGEITLTYVVLYIWDERRLILPATYFTTQPFTNWTRKSDLIKGTIFLDVDWRVPIRELRAKFMEIVNSAETWDGRGANMVVYDATGGHVTVRFTVSSKDSDDIWDLRCHVREELVVWLQSNHPDALPVTRVLVPPTGES
jgi:small-conductance mechanosensitive channel